MQTRRSFLKAAAAAASGAWLPGCLNTAKNGRSYSVSILGDTHFDSTDPKFYHRDYTHSTTKKRYELHLSEHVRNAAMWAERMPSLVRASAACARPDAAFALQVGDLVQGDCGNPATHRRMLDDAFSLIKTAYGGRLPLVTVVGNHDIRGDIPEDGALAAFDAWQPPKMTKELGVSVTGTTFAFRQGPDVFLFVDFNAPRPDLALVKALLDESDGARYLFVVSHGPVIPSGTSRWFLVGSSKRDAERRELRALLARRNAIVLAGHTHITEFHDCVFPEGRITQYVANSVWSQPDLGALTVVDEGAAAYGNRVAATRKHKKEGPRTSGLEALVAEYKPFVKDYLYAKGAGHSRMEVSDAGVKIHYFAGAATTPARTFTLRG